MANAENAYGRKDFATTLALLEDYESPDPIFDNARYLLEYLSCVALAENALSEGKHKYAAALLERAENARVNTIYAPRREQLQLLRYQIEPACAGELEIAVDDALLIKAEGALPCCALKRRRKRPKMAALTILPPHSPSVRLKMPGG